MFIEIVVPKGRFDMRRRQALAERLTGRRLLSAGGHDDIAAADPGVIDLLDSLTDVVVREEEVWVAGGRPAAGDARYVVNVIAGMWGKELSDHLVTRITAELTEAEQGPEPHVMVNVVTVPEGGYGLRGRVHRSPDLLRLIEQAKTGPREPAPEGTVVDPVCGATVPIGEAVMLERDGRTYGFCCPHCRGHFARSLQEAGTP
ncbi:hypothetical protein Nocox_07065 [Nonomuraea coxensis DSM 45129]|uniref:TRASH domain-containing protein n=1 Tax=Nonomuraea coxensis DSM 45129 TaxID=1122611 RepID=A0ABX8TVR5_9ACTN|nr:hypothetical protein Nocox_07065 [Nonomuraea coxensis DSM 45129]